MKQPWIIESLLDLDVYKLYMSQFNWVYYRNVETRFGFTNRTKVRLADFVSIEELKAEIENVRDLKVTNKEVRYLARLTGKSGKRIFRFDFIQAFAELSLPPVEIGVADGHLVINTVGDWWVVSIWETIIMAIVNELYFRAIVKESGKSLADVYKEGMDRLARKILHLRDYPSVKFSDFGTRRRFSRAWHVQVMDVLYREFGDEPRFLGTSNVAIAMRYNGTPVGTHAHEELMCIAALYGETPEGLRGSQKKFFSQWEELYGPDLLTALSDTFGSKAFFEDFVDFAHRWSAVRHDSADPFKFGEEVIAFYQKQGIDPMNGSAIVFSDGLDEKTITELFYHFQDRIWMVFGWGTNLTNDLGFKALSIVMKAMATRWKGEQDWRYTVKLSDNPLKAMSDGGPELIKHYKNVFDYDEHEPMKVVY